MTSRTLPGTPTRDQKRRRAVTNSASASGDTNPEHNPSVARRLQYGDEDEDVSSDSSFIEFLEVRQGPVPEVVAEVVASAAGPIPPIGALGPPAGPPPGHNPPIAALGPPALPMPAPIMGWYAMVVREAEQQIWIRQIEQQAPAPIPRLNIGGAAAVVPIGPTQPPNLDETTWTDEKRATVIRKIFERIDRHRQGGGSPTDAVTTAYKNKVNQIMGAAGFRAGTGLDTRVGDGYTTIDHKQACLYHMHLALENFDFSLALDRVDPLTTQSMSQVINPFITNSPPLAALKAIQGQDARFLKTNSAINTLIVIQSNNPYQVGQWVEIDHFLTFVVAMYPELYKRNLQMELAAFKNVQLYHWIDNYRSNKKKIIWSHEFRHVRQLSDQEMIHGMYYHHYIFCDSMLQTFNERFVGERDCSLLLSPAEKDYVLNRNDRIWSAAPSVVNGRGRVW